LGPLQVVLDGRPLDFGGQRQERLMATLALGAQRTVSFDELIDALWENDPPDTARRQVHNAVAVLRRSLGPLRSMIRTGSRGYMATVAPEHIDASRFHLAVDEAGRALSEGNREMAVSALGRGLGFWRGAALAGLDGQAIRAAAAKLEEQRLAATERLLGLRMEGGEAGELIPELQELVSISPLRESFRRQLMLALHRAGRQADALEVYESGRMLLAAELGLDPGAEMRRLHDQILRSDPSIEWRPPAPRGPAVLPPPGRATAESRTPRRRPGTDAPVDSQVHQRRFLPYDITDFTGREHELSGLVGLAESAGGPGVLICSVDGMAGVGKTVLAVRAAHILASRYPDGQLFIDLHGSSPGHNPLTPDQALGQLLRDLGVDPQRIPDDVEQRAAVWRAALAGQRVLVVLDDALDVHQVRPLLPGSQGAMVLITSRRRLLTLEGAATLSLGMMPPEHAAELFGRVAGGQRTSTEPTQVARVVMLCGHLPLAVRIAASRLRHRPTWSVGHLAARLESRLHWLPELAADNHGVEAAFEGSYRQLTEVQRRLLRLLSLHPAREFSAADAATLADIPVDHAEQVLESLFDCHLLSQNSAGQYSLHNLIGQYALGKLLRSRTAADRTAALRRLQGLPPELGPAQRRGPGARRAGKRQGSDPEVVTWEAPVCRPTAVRSA
jgi:DNA-binding SARP family transcriptional activator